MASVFYKKWYLCTDHLGSIELTIFPSGYVQRASFDAWGRRRNPDNWSYPSYNYNLSGFSDLFFDRGFTGHEHLLEFGLINMNGRLYDPVVGRMLSPDNYAGSNGTQSLNRYSYALNNPLSYVDPDGNNPLLIAMAVGAISNVAIQAWNGHVNSLKDMGLAMAVGAASGLVGGYMGGAVAGAVGGGFLGGAAIGAAGGFYGGLVSGIGNSLINGSSFDKALQAGIVGGMQGALAGAVMGGITRAFIDNANGYSFWDGDGEPMCDYNGGVISDSQGTGPASTSDDKKLNTRINKALHVKEGDYGIKKITGGTSNGMREIYGGEYDGYFWDGKGVINGYALPNSSGHSTVHISRAVINTSDDLFFREVASHEVIHAYHLYNLPSIYQSARKDFIKNSEFYAYRHSFDVYYQNNQWLRAYGVSGVAHRNGYWGNADTFFDIPSMLPFLRY